MNDQRPNADHAFEAITQANRVGRMARMLPENEPLKPNRRTDIIERFYRFIEKVGVTQNQVAREIGGSSTTISEVLRQKYNGKSGDAWLVKINNWIELAARRHALVKGREFVEHSVAADILTVASIVAETCQMGVVFGPARIGKTFTLRAIEGDQAYGDPILIRVDQSTTRPFALCRSICDRFDISMDGTFDAVFRRLVKRLADTKRMLMFDEADRVSYPALEMIRDLHDATGCPILLAGKPRIYEHLGLREIGEFKERLDQLAGRIAIKRDLTERTRGGNGEPLFSLDDIRKMIGQKSLVLKMSPDAERWLQAKASTLGLGGIGRAMSNLYLASRFADGDGSTVITVEHLEQAERLTRGYEDSEMMSEVVAASAGMKRVV